MYNVQMLQTLIKAGLTQKPEGASDQDWQAALAGATTAPEVQPTVIEASPAPTAQAVAVAQPQTTVVAQAQAPEQTFTAKHEYTFDDFKSNQLAVDGILVLKNGTPFISKKEILKKPFKATLLFDETRVKQVIKANVNGQATYFSTYGDGVDSRDGTPFQSKIDYCKRLDPKAFVYPSAELVLILDEDVTDMAGKVVAQKGMKIGHSTSATNRKVLNEFYDECKMKNIDIKSAHVPVIMGFKQMENNKGNVWTCVTLELVG